jgi:hypothetical protein
MGRFRAGPANFSKTAFKISGLKGGRAAARLERRFRNLGISQLIRRTICMTWSGLRAELNNRIAILQNNIRQLVQQAAGSVGARDEERISDRISQQNEELERLTKERDALLNR